MMTRRLPRAACWFTPPLNWCICDAKDGQLAAGRMLIDDLLDRQPFPSG